MYTCLLSTQGVVKIHKKMQFKLKSKYQPTGDQPSAIKELVADLNSGKRHNTLLGVTGSGKTFSVGNVIEKIQKPTLVIAHNKTLAAQLYQEFRDYFPENAVSYFVSYYDYYQPEAYIPSTDTYIEKEATINEEIDKLRLSSTTNLLTRPDCIVVASVSCIYNLGSPVEYGKYTLELVVGQILSRESLLLQLANLQYDRSDTEFSRGTYRIRGDSIQLWPAYEDNALRIDTFENVIESIKWIDPISGSATTPNNQSIHQSYQPEQKHFVIYPAKHYLMDPKSQVEAIEEIKNDLSLRVQDLEKQGKIIEAHRLKQKVGYDISQMQEFGFVNGIENYSRYFDDRESGEPPFTLIDYFQHNANEFGDGSFLTVVDESHMTLSQIKGMFEGDKARKKTLIEYGFRLPSALDNRPLTIDEFMNKTDLMTYVSATPNPKEIELSGGKVVEQLIRPTGLVDPNIELRPTTGQIEDLIVEVIKRKQIGQRVLVTTLTKKMAEALTDYLNDKDKVQHLIESHKRKLKEQKEAESEELIVGDDLSETTVWNEEELPIESIEIGKIEDKYFSHLKTRVRTADQVELDDIDYPKVAYLHSDIDTLDRSDILDDLRRGEYDVLVGINLLREGLDLPEVSLVAILDADKEGFLRSRTSMIQTMGRSARHVEGHAILYADRMTGSIKKAIEETLRRRRTQIQHNLDQGIDPQTIIKPIRDKLIKNQQKNKKKRGSGLDLESGEQKVFVQLKKGERIDLMSIDPQALTPDDKNKLSKKLKRRMNQAVKDMDFELAAMIRDVIKNL
jgi:excinuclease ABC subunit B